MLLQSARDLKRQVAFEIFEPLANDMIEHVLRPKLDRFKLALPTGRIGIGIGIGRQPGEFSLALRLQDKHPVIDAMVQRIIAMAKDEVDVSFVGALHPFNAPTDPATLQGQCRPLVLGCSIAHATATAGTLGLICRHNKTNRPVLVSNSHVLARAGMAAIGDGITQPGRLDAGGAAPHVAALLDFVPLKTSGSNLVDIAVAVPDPTIDLVPGTIAGIGAFTIPTANALAPKTKVMKLGRTSGLTVGTVTATEVDHILVGYDIGNVTFDDQIEIKGIDAPFSKEGDSGSLVVTDAKEAVGLVFCGNEFTDDGLGVTYANSLVRGMSALNLGPL